MEEILAEALAVAAPQRAAGRVADYIPALARVDPDKLGIAFAGADGTVHGAGDCDEPFSIQSISKVFMLALALEKVGVKLWDKVGREPSGDPFNSIVQLEHERGKPRNPLINAGAVVVTDALIGDGPAEAAIDALLALLRGQAGSGNIAVDEEVAASESQTGARNRSLGWFMRSFGNLSNPVEEVLGIYFRQCAVAMSCRQLARAGLFLAFDGRDPVTGRAVCPWHRARRINSVMMLCGHYDNSGEFAFRVGLPGKSGVGGGILAIAPGHGAIAAWSPALNAAGTSAAGAAALEALVERTGWSVFV
ncbi:glutaminase [Sphingosinicella sp. LHD-64]|uniref:glutaminase n=1 Tax=Sphingosinicella sp. LHD-64 TaxID=3072139 RepID=UPI00280E62F9|nr:glutaminase [Sphingosinicella sp. LHD-64]MDQ8755743.1 glutaminase [Sphingosinicella sp. LHD-64]